MPACRSPSSRGSISRAAAVSASRTPLWFVRSKTAAPSYSPSRPRSCSSCSGLSWHTRHSPVRRAIFRSQKHAGDTTLVATTNDLKNGIVLKLDNGQLWSVVEFQHVKPGKGGAFVRTKLKHVLSGKVVDKTFNAGTKVETATVDKRGMQFSYKDGADFVFMDTDTYEQLPISPETVGD